MADVLTMAGSLPRDAECSISTTRTELANEAMENMHRISHAVYASDHAMHDICTLQEDGLR